MTAICGGGTSGPKFGVSGTILYTADAIAGTLERFGAPWAVILGILIAEISYDAITFCGSDPPAVPTFTSAEIDAMLKLDFGPDLTSGVSKVKDLVANRAWYDLCHCTSVVTPPAGDIAPPAAMPIVKQPPFLAYPCGRRLNGDSAAINNSNSYAYGSGAYEASPATTVRITASNRIFSGQGTDYNYWFRPGDATGADIGTQASHSFLVPAGQTVTHDFAVPSNSVGYTATILGTGTKTGTSINSGQVDVYCGGQVPDILTSPCPPDPITIGLLRQILALLTLVQRQQVPFSSVHGTVHSGLTGAGHFAVQGILGLAVSITTLPSYVGYAAGDPNSIYDVGWINLGTADGWSSRSRVTANGWITFPPAAGALTIVGYTFMPGIVATITELEREP